MGQDPDCVVRTMAAYSTGKLGPSCAEDFGSVIALLAKLLDDADYFMRSTAAAALGEIGKAAAPLAWRLKQLLKDDSADVRNAAACALGKMGSHSKPFVKDLLQILTDPSGPVRNKAAEALGNLGHLVPYTESDFKKLLLCLHDTVFAVRQNAANTVGKLSGTLVGYLAVEPLMQLLGDPDTNVRRHSC